MNRWVLGTVMKLKPWINWRTGLVRYDETTTSNDSQQATALLTELELQI